MAFRATFSWNRHRTCRLSFRGRGAGFDLPDRTAVGQRLRNHVGASVWLRAWALHPQRHLRPACPAASGSNVKGVRGAHMAGGCTERGVPGVNPAPWRLVEPSCRRNAGDAAVLPRLRNHAGTDAGGRNSHPRHLGVAVPRTGDRCGPPLDPALYGTGNLVTYRRLGGDRRDRHDPAADSAGDRPRCVHRRHGHVCGAGGVPGRRPCSARRAVGDRP